MSTLETHRMNPQRLVIALLFAMPLVAEPARAAATGFVYEGRLDDGGTPANGHYDLRLSPFVDAKSGAALSAPLVFEDVPVVDGRFRIDFDLPLATASSTWIEVGVRDGNAVGGFSAIPGRSEAASAKAIGACWSSTGDSATNPAVNFLGTTDAQPLVLRVQNQSVARYEPSSFLFGGVPATANVIAGAAVNGIFSGVRGAVIAGGGMPVDSDPSVSGEAPNLVNDDFGTVGGGYGNLAGDGLIDRTSASVATVAGGAGNAASGYSASVGGGLNNAATDAGATVAGGQGNTASGLVATVSGGSENVASGEWATVGGGLQNVASTQTSVIAGGRANVVSGTSASVGGGFENSATASQATVSGGRSNLASGSTATISGGTGNRATGSTSIIVGGASNEAASAGATVGGGSQNCAGGQISWVAGFAGKIRPGTGLTFPAGAACAGVALSGDANGDEGTFLWNGGSAEFTSTGSRQFLINSPNGAAINSNDPAGNTLRVGGTLRVDALGSTGTATLCRNANNQLSACSSSARYKEHITDLELGLAVVERLRPVAYEWKSTREADIGFVAEEIAAIDPRLVTRNAAGEVEGVKYERLTAVLAVALQESNARAALEIAALRAALQRADADNAAQDARLAALEASLDTRRAD
jgi:hypothetical protein